MREQKGRREAAAFLVEGPRAVAQICQVCPQNVIEILAVDIAAFTRPATAVSRVTQRQLDAICPSRTPQGVAAVVGIPPGVNSDSLPPEACTRVLALDDIQDPGNVGTLVRTAAALGFDGVLMSGKCADPFSPKAVQASAGSVLSVWIRRGPAFLRLIGDLKARGFRVAAAELGGEPHLPRDFAGPAVLALGNEGNGLSQSCRGLADHMLSIPIDTRRVESLNVAAAGAICMHMIRASHAPSSHA